MRDTINNLLKLIRIKQWIKNLFIFAPLIFANQFLNHEAIFQSIIAFFIFSLAASIVYIINDIYDIESDREHPKKSISRPLASGALSNKHAYFMLAFLFTLVLASLSQMLSLIPIILIYIIQNLIYSKFLKHQPVLDIFSISFGFVLRVYAGTIAIEVPLSNWMFITALSLALFLASMKRKSELETQGTSARKVLKKYNKSLINKFAEISSSSTLVFYSLYILSEQPKMVITIPLVLFGLFRYWYISTLKSGTESPTDALLEDKQLLLVVALWVTLVVLVLMGTI